MFKINKDSDIYSMIADGLATLIGFGASLLVGSFCNSIMSTQDNGFFKNGLCNIGKYGLETVTTFAVAKNMRDNIDDMADFYNKQADMVNAYNEQQAEEMFKPEVVYPDEIK